MSRKSAHLQPYPRQSNHLAEDGLPNHAQCTVIHGDSREQLAAFAGQVDLLVTSPPYADARKNHYDSIHPDQYTEWFLTFHEAFYQALKPSGSLVINIKDKVVNGVRHRYVWQTMEALSNLGWFAIEDYIWQKPNPMPGYWPTRLRDGWEYCFHLAKSKRPYFNSDAVRQPIGDWVESRLTKLSQNDLNRHNSVNASGFGRNISKWVGKETALPSNVIRAPLVGKNKGHPAVFPVGLPLFFIKLLCPEDGLVVDPFGGSGTTGLAALSLNRRCVLIDNNAEYCRVALERLQEEATRQIVTKPAAEGKWTAECPSLPGLFSQADTKEKAVEKIREAMPVYMEILTDALLSTPLVQ